MPAPLRAQREGAQAGASASGGGSSKAANADLRRCSAADLANVAATLPAEPFGDVLLAHGAELVAHAVCGWGAEAQIYSKKIDWHTHELMMKTPYYFVC